MHSAFSFAIYILCQTWGPIFAKTSALPMRRDGMGTVNGYKSLDGIDVAVVDISGRRVRTVAHRTFPYAAATRARILAASTAAEISRLNFELGELYARAVRNTYPPETIRLIGCHGQTIFHEGSTTLQIGEAAVIAERLGIPVVSDFRTRDIAAGGQGAPLVPFADYLLFHSRRVNRVALNIGGIANITVLPAGAPASMVIAFDTGPGNMVIDQLVELFTGGRRRYDRGGRIAGQGHINRKLLNSLLSDSYFKARPPKTAGREQYGAEFVARLVWDENVYGRSDRHRYRFHGGFNRDGNREHRRGDRGRRRRSQPAAYGPACRAPARCPHYNHGGIRHRSGCEGSHRVGDSGSSHVAS